MSTCKSIYELLVIQTFYLFISICKNKNLLIRNVFMSTCEIVISTSSRLKQISNMYTSLFSSMIYVIYWRRKSCLASTTCSCRSLASGLKKKTGWTTWELQCQIWYIYCAQKTYASFGLINLINTEFLWQQ